MRIDLPKEAALPALLLVLAAGYVLRPSDLRRSPWIEVQSLVGVNSKYEVSYAGCADRRDDTVSTDLAGLATAMVGRYRFKFAATDDADAVAFVRAARPDCDVVQLNRMKRFVFPPIYSRGSSHWREPIDVGDYPA